MSITVEIPPEVLAKKALDRATIEQCRANYAHASKMFDQAQKLLRGTAQDARDALEVIGLGLGGLSVDDKVFGAASKRYECARAAYGEYAALLATAARELLESGLDLDERNKMVLQCEAAR